uniref:Peroxiredoxin-like 2 activated in M-CSF stimulated monocytes n=1 Tax=Grammatophora oceanica TaxID=210454 RepID=A0A7S1YHB2_9STRA|mmetsp:Transcript_49171/g.73318  ORF Transcript_49171/g.73318 Transcript_49171/m.73318 type:complete len:136 (+) Transcript_49171:455-862(+)
MAGFGMVGVIKETGVDDEYLTSFHDKYYPYPLYRDENLDFYSYLGNRKLEFNVGYNPINWVKGFFGLRAVGKRLKAKNIDGNMNGEGLTKGGVVIFGKDGTPKYAYQEDGEMPVEEILAAVQMVKQEQVESVVGA